MKKREFKRSNENPENKIDTIIERSLEVIKNTNLEDIEADIGKSMEREFVASLPQIKYSIENDGVDVECIFEYSPEHANLWQSKIGIYYNGKFFTKLIDVNFQPSEEEKELALYHFRCNRPISRGAVEIGDIKGEKLADLAAMFALSMGKSDVLNLIQFSEAYERVYYTTTRSNVRGKYGGSSWSTGEYTTTKGYSSSWLVDYQDILKKIGSTIQYSTSSEEKAKKTTRKERLENICNGYFVMFVKRLSKEVAELPFYNEKNGEWDNEDLKDLYNILSEWLEILINDVGIDRYNINAQSFKNVSKDDIPKRLKLEIFDYLSIGSPDDDERKKALKDSDILISEIPEMLEKLEIVDKDSYRDSLREYEYLEETRERMAHDYRYVLSEVKKVFNEIKTALIDADIAIQEEYRRNNTELSPEQKASEEEMKIRIREVEERLRIVLRYGVDIDNFGTLSSDDFNKLYSRYNNITSFDNKDVELNHILEALEGIENKIKEADKERYELLIHTNEAWDTKEARDFLSLSEDRNNLVGYIVVRNGTVFDINGRVIDGVGRYKVEKGPMSTSIRFYTRSGKPDFPNFDLSDGEYVIFDNAYVDNTYLSELWSVEFDEDFKVPIRIVGPVTHRDSVDEPIYQEEVIPRTFKQRDKKPESTYIPRFYSRGSENAFRETLSNELQEKFRASLNLIIEKMKIVSMFNLGSKESEDLLGAVNKRLGLLANSSEKKMLKELKKFEVKSSKIFKRIGNDRGWVENWLERADEVLGKILPELKIEGYDLSSVYDGVEELFDLVIGDADLSMKDLREGVIDSFMLEIKE